MVALGTFIQAKGGAMRLRFLDWRPKPLRAFSTLLFWLLVGVPLNILIDLLYPQSDSCNSPKGGTKMEKGIQIKLLVAIETLNVYVNGEKHLVRLGTVKEDTDFLNAEQFEEVANLFFASIPTWARKHGEEKIKPFIDEFDQVIGEHWAA